MRINKYFSMRVRFSPHYEELCFLKKQYSIAPEISLNDLNRRKEVEFMTINKYWIEKLATLGALWQHDGNKKRPYALLTSGLISDGFINCSKLIERPSALEGVVDSLLRRAPDLPTNNVVVVGSAMGGITFAHEVARQLGIQFRMWWTEKHDGLMHLADRFEVTGDEIVLLVEDVMTTGDTTRKTRHAMTQMGVKKFVEFTLVIANRSGHDVFEGNPLVSLVDLNFNVWEKGRNPYLDDGKEYVEPVRPKGNWDILTQSYES